MTREDLLSEATPVSVVRCIGVLSWTVRGGFQHMNSIGSGKHCIFHPSGESRGNHNGKQDMFREERPLWQKHKNQNIHPEQNIYLFKYPRHGFTL